jgi:hypothetical protein
MCGRRLAPKPCMNYQCPHNLFWKGLNLNPENFKITNRALEIGNCCWLINEPWSEEDIREAWGLPTENIIRCEGMAWRKIHKKDGWEQSYRPVLSLSLLN